MGARLEPQPEPGQHAGREKGIISVSSEPTNFARAKRLAWSYDPGTRRVRQLPEFGFDQPLSGTGGKMTIDSDRLFKGSPERYTWKLVGKREMYVPANSYKIHANTVKYVDLIKPGHALLRIRHAGLACGFGFLL